MRDAANRIQSANNLRQLGLAVNNLSGQTSDGPLPPTFGPYAGKSGSVFFHLLPYLEQDAVYNSGATGTPIKTYIAAADSTNNNGAAFTSYGANANLFIAGTRFPSGLEPKGTSNTILFFERAANNANLWAGGNTGLQMGPGAAILSRQTSYPQGGPFGATALSGTVCEVGLADGSVRSFNVAGSATVTPFGWGCQFARSDHGAKKD